MLVWALGLFAQTMPVCSRFSYHNRTFILQGDLLGTGNLQLSEVDAQNNVLDYCTWQYEQNGIIKDGAKMINAVSNSEVPMFTLMMGASFGAGNYAMCGKAYDPRFIYAWPSAKIAVMGGDQAAKTLLQIQVASMKAKGKEVSAEEEKTLLDKIKGSYEKQTTPYYAAARLWVDDIIDPAATRQLISEGITAANHNPHIEEMKTGVFQV